ncbi:MAG: SpoIIE family protein phosphatase, partial [Calditrichaceae bacterium]
MFKNVKKEEITVPAQMSYLIQVREFIEHIGKRYKFDDKVINSFKLVIDEACTNIIRHGYRDIKNGEITIKAIIRRLSLTILIIDQGRSYDPSQASSPDLGKYVDIGKKGGLGILMMRKLMDDLQYTVTERGNEFRLTKNRENVQEPKIIQKWHELNLKAKYSLIASVIFTIVILFIFSWLIVGTEKSIKQEVLDVTSSGTLSLADNVISDMMNDDDINLFEAADALSKNYKGVIKEVFILDTAKHVQARSNVLLTGTLGQYHIPESAVLVDSVNGLPVYSYTAMIDTTEIYDIEAEIHQTTTGEGALLGYVHTWIAQETIAHKANTRTRNLLIIMAIILLIGYTGSFFLIHRILTPFHSLADWVRQVVHGKVDQDEIDIDASDELGEIAQAFNEMTTKFRKAQVNLMEQQKLQKELQVAQEIQQMLLPNDFPKVEGYEIASFYEAAKEVGGDLFDFVEVDDDTIGICVADVSGKGVPGSLIMTMIRTALRLESRGNKNPADVLARVNSFVADDMKRGMFVTMFYVILDSRNRIIHYASAGHNPMILYRGSTKQTYYLNPSGFPVGIQLPDPELFAKKIETDSIRLREDDILVLYTDGITEAMNSQRDLYREERFLSAIRDNAHLDVGEFIKSINGDLKNFTGGAQQNDDITFVSIKEKLMQSEVILRIQKELSRLIDDGMYVKDALEQLRVSPYYYYKYKDIIENEGLDGLKNFLEGQDHIEKKHLSLEVKTKIFNIISKNPAYGAKRIADELASDEYGNLDLDPQRIYNELVKLRLNTRQLRERHLEKGKRKHFKQPGTPLLTLDGSVILNYESAEEEIAKRSGESPISLKPLPAEEKPKVRKEFVRSVRSEKDIEKSAESEEKSGDTEAIPAAEPPKAEADKVDKPVEPVESEPELKEETQASEPVGSISEPSDEKTEKITVDLKSEDEKAKPEKPEHTIESREDIKSETKIPEPETTEPKEEKTPVIDKDKEETEEKPEFEIDLISEPDPDKKPFPEPPAKAEDKKPIQLEDKSYKKEELLKKVTSIVDKKAVNKFYTMIGDDLKALEST